MININNILTQLNAKMAADIADSYNIPELVKRVQAYQKLNVDAGTVPEYSSYNELPDSDSANIGQIVYVRQKPASRGDFGNDIKDSAGTFFFGKKVDTNTIGWQKILLLQGDSDYADIAAASSTPHYQGTISGYVSGGLSIPPATYTNLINKFSFTSDANGTDVGDLTVATSQGAGQSSSTHGYYSGGRKPSNSNVIHKFSFSVDGNATDVGDLIASMGAVSGQSSETHGYVAGGNNPSHLDTIQKFPFAADGNATDVGNLESAKSSADGTNSTQSGYTHGGNNPPAPATLNAISKFPFAADADATDVGDLLTILSSSSGQSSSTHGYASGGTATTTYSDVIQKYSFSTNGNSTDVGNLTTERRFLSGSQSTTFGYTAGGNSPNVSPPHHNEIEKFSFSSDGNSTDVGDLTSKLARSGQGQQV